MATTIDVCSCGFARTPSNAELHADCSELPFSPTRPARPQVRPEPVRRERIVEVRHDADILGEYLDVERTPKGGVVIHHTIMGRSIDFACLTADEAAELCAFLLRTLRPAGARYELTEAGRRAVAEARS